MVFAMGFLQFGDGEVKVTLGGGKAAAAEHFLDMAEIGFALQKLRGATVPPQVVGHMLFDPGSSGVFGHQFAQRVAGNGKTAQ